MKQLQFLSILLAGIIFYSCGNNPSSEKIAADPLIEHIDSSVSPGKDFFSFANGTWFKKNPIPASETGNGIFLMVGDSVNNVLKLICESTAKETNLEKGSNKQKIGDFFFSGMDTVTIEKLGRTPLDEEIKKIEAIKTKDDVLARGFSGYLPKPLNPSTLVAYLEERLSRRSA